MIGSLKNADLNSVKTLLVHGQCPDGRASAMILHDVFPEAEVRFLMHNTDEYKNLHPMPGMIFCDIAPPAKTVRGPVDRTIHDVDQNIRRWIDAGTVVLDHHKQSLSICLPFCERGLGLFADEVEDKGVSGALLAYEVWKKRTPLAGIAADNKFWDFARVAGVRDTWQKSDPLWEKSCWQKEALMFLSEKELLELGVERFLEAENSGLGRRLFERHMRSVEHAADVATRMVVDGHAVYVLNASGPIVSDASDILFERDQPKDDSPLAFIAGFSFVFEDGRQKLIWSCRSRSHQGRPAFDVGAFAKRLGGGGHSQAAGFSLVLPEDEMGCNPYKTLSNVLSHYLELT